MNIVVVAPHPDDAELGMGGTIARLVNEGHDVLIVDLTDGEPTPQGSPSKRVAEAEAARAILGCRRLNLALPNRRILTTRIPIISPQHASPPMLGLMRNFRTAISAANRFTRAD